MSENFTKAVNYFSKKEFKNALLYFSLSANEGTLEIESKIGALISDFAMENESEAEALFEYFLVSKSGEFRDLDELYDEISQIIDDLSFDEEEYQELSDLENFLNEDNSIKYEDFIELINQRGNFKKAFEDIMFSTKVLISKKDDFVDFLDKLIDNGFTDISMNYIENAIAVFPNDQQLISLIKKVQNLEDTDKR